MYLEYFTVITNCKLFKTVFICLETMQTHDTPKFFKIATPKFSDAKKCGLETLRYGRVRNLKFARNLKFTTSKTLVNFMKKLMFLSKNWYFSVQKALIYYTVNKSHHHSFILLVFSHVANFRYVANFRFLTLVKFPLIKTYNKVN